MPTYKISQLTTATAVSATNQFEINQNGTSKSVEVSVIDAYIKSTSNLPVVVSVSSATDAVRITQTGTGNALVVEDSANPDATPFVVDASGNVGIGTSSPSQKLAVTGSIKAFDGLFFGSDENYWYQSAANTATLRVGTSTNTSYLSIKGVSGLPIIDGIGGNLAFATSGTERMRVDSSGNVGIGTSSPSNKLSIVSSTQYSGITLGNGTYTTVELVGFSATNDEGGITFKQAGTTNAQILANGTSFFNGGNVGIGTSAPTNKLSVDGSMNASNYYMQDSSAAAAGTYGFGNSNGPYIQTWGNSSAQAGALLFATSGSERARITSGGNFFVNATALPAGTHNVAGTIYTQGFYSNYGIGSHSGIGGAYQTNAINFQWNSSAVRLWVDTTDLGGITVSSDYRVKKDIKTQAATALDRVLQIRPVTYTYADYAPFSWKADGVSREGFIAHELAAIIPSAVEGEKDEPNKVQSLKLDALCSVLVKAIQELKADFDAYKAAHP